VGGDAGDVQPSGVVLEEREGVDAVAERGVEVEEVDGDDRVRVVGEELCPGWTGTAWGRVDTVSGSRTRLSALTCGFRLPVRTR
jgi:hypothetical protein